MYTYIYTFTCIHILYDSSYCYRFISGVSEAGRESHLPNLHDPLAPRPHTLSEAVSRPEGREILQKMVKHSVLQMQQVARSSDGAVANSVWLYYVEPQIEVRYYIILHYITLLYNYIMK